MPFIYECETQDKESGANGEAATLNAEDSEQPVRFREALRAIYIQGKEMKSILPNLQMKRRIETRAHARLAMGNRVENQKSCRYDLQEGGGDMTVL